MEGARKQVLVTGSSGFIGHNVVKLLKDYDVTGIDCHETYATLDVKTVRRLVKERRRHIGRDFMEINYDIRSVYPELPMVLKRNHIDPEFVIHTASYPRQYEVNFDPVEASNTMIGGLLNVLEAVRATCKRFVFISSSMVYGNFSNFVDEQYPTNPTCLYGILKAAGERIVVDFCTKNDIEYTIIRPSAVYGERDTSNRLVGKFLNTAMNKGTLQVRGANEVLDFTYVEDLARGIVDATFSTNARNDVFNLTRSNEEIVTILKAAVAVTNIVGGGGIDIQDRDDSFPLRGNLSIERARQKFGYNPTTNIEEGFRNYYDWLRTFQQQ